MVFPDLEVTCPGCGASRLKQTDKTYECRELECNFSISKYIAGRHLIEAEAIELLREKALPEMEGFISRFNKPFSAGLKLVEKESKTKKLKWKTEFVFDDEEGSDEPLDLSKVACELTFLNGESYKVYETEKSFIVPDLKSTASPDGFKLGKTILQQTLNLEAVKALFSTGKTPLIEGFISKRTKRPFKAHLTFDEKTGKIGFEFPANGKFKSKKK